MCIRINGDINDVAEMYLDNELRSIKSFLEEVLDLPGRPTINELLGAVKHELHEDEEVETKEKSVFFVSQYIHGDVYWYRLEKFLGGTVAGEEVSPQEALYADIFWEEIDSCGGFYGSDVTENGMTEHWPEMEEVA